MRNHQTFKPRVALVTGAGSGMGRVAAHRLAAAGTQVVAVDVDEAGLDETSKLHPGIRARVCDVTDGPTMAELVASAESEVGPIDRLMACAAIAPTAPLAEQPVETILRTMEINYGGVVRAVKAVLPAMSKLPMNGDRRGEIVVFASLAGWVPTPRLGAYAATKHALVAFTETLAHEQCGSGVRFLCVCPGLVGTPMVAQLEAGGITAHRSARAAEPAEVIDAIDKALPGKKLFIYPGQAACAMVAARRIAPKVVWKLLDRSMK